MDSIKVSHHKTPKIRTTLRRTGYLKHCFCHWNIETVANLGGPAFAGQKQGQDGPKCADPVTSGTQGISLDAQDIAVSQDLVALEIPSILLIWGGGGDITRFLGPSGP